MFFAPSKSREREQKFRSWVYQRPVIISKYRSKRQTPVRNHQQPPKPKMRLKGHGCSLHLQSQDREPKFGSWVYQRPVTISKTRSRYKTLVRNLQRPLKPQNQDLKDMDVLCKLKIKLESKFWSMGVPKTSEHIQINIRMPNPSQEPPASSKAPNQDLKDMDVLCTFKIKIESQNSEYGCTKDQWPYTNQDLYPKPQSNPPVSSKAPYQVLKDLDVLCTLKIKIESQNSAYGCTKDQ